MHGELCATYESASTRRFQSGRVDCIRASHLEALTWVKSMIPKNVGHQISNPELRNNQRNLFMLAIAKQTKVSNFSI